MQTYIHTKKAPAEEWQERVVNGMIKLIWKCDNAPQMQKCFASFWFPFCLRWLAGRPFILLFMCCISVSMIAISKWSSPSLNRNILSARECARALARSQMSGKSIEFLQNVMDASKNKQYLMLHTGNDVYSVVYVNIQNDFHF